MNECRFTNEIFYRDETGQAWAIIDPEHPKLNHWLVGEIATQS